MNSKINLFDYFIIHRKKVCCQFDQSIWHLSFIYLDPSSIYIGFKGPSLFYAQDYSLSGSLFKIIYLNFRKKNLTFILINFLQKLLFLPTKGFKKPPSKAAQNTELFSSLLPWAAITAQTEEFMFQNLAFGPTVYKTGHWP